MRCCAKNMEPSVSRCIHSSILQNFHFFMFSFSWGKFWLHPLWFVYAVKVVVCPQPGSRLVVGNIMIRRPTTSFTLRTPCVAPQSTLVTSLYFNAEVTLSRELSGGAALKR